MMNDDEKLELVKGGMATVLEAAAFLKVCRQTIYNLIASGNLLSLPVRKARRIPWIALHRYAAGNLQGGW